MDDTNASKTLLSLEELQNGNSAQTEAAPEFVDPPKGRYKALAQAKFEEFKKTDDTTGIEETGVRIRVVYSIAEVVEMKDKDELQPAKGSLFSETFLGTAEGLKYFKTRAQGIMGDLGTATWGEVIAAICSKKEPFMVDIGRRSSKVKDKKTGEEKVYENITVKVVGEVADVA